MDSIFQVSYHRLMRCRYYHTGHIWDKGKDRFAARGKIIKFNYIICCFILRTWVPSSLNCVKQTEAQRGLATCSWFGETPKPVLFHWVALPSKLQRNTYFGCSLFPLWAIHFSIVFIHFCKYQSNAHFGFLNFVILLNHLELPYLVMCCVSKEFLPWQL